ncbi:MAG: hypothetical protein RL367_547, partial [Pseudomonadota bacterium]
MREPGVGFLPTGPTATPLDRLRALVLAGHALQTQLGAISDVNQFVAAATGIAAVHGLAVDPADLAQALRPDPLGIGRITQARLTRHDWPEPGWRPTALVQIGAEMAVNWTWFGPDNPVEPFFEDSVWRAQALPLNRMVGHYTPLMALAETLPADAQSDPDGLIFHMSRCGSTLVSQTLAADPQNCVISESTALDTVIRIAAEQTDI